MKKMILALSMILTIGLSAVYATGERDIDPRVLSAFEKEFSFARNVVWKVENEISVARFSLNDQGFVAYFTQNGELVGTARNLLYMQLPLSIIRQLDEKYPQAGISGIVEFTKSNETSYFIDVETKELKLTLQAYTGGNIYIVKKQKI